MQGFFLHYNLTELLAAKTLRSVYLAHPLRERQHKFIIKIFAKECAGQNQGVGLARIATLTALDHPHIVPIVDIALEEQGKPYFISEYRVHGSLRQRLDRLAPEHMDWQEAISTVIQIGQALSYAHGQNAIHGNMKPENVFYNDVGEVQLTDFSLAPFIDVTKLEYKSDLCTTRYMAPEQFMGKTDQQSDQYALACLAYELVTGHTPFKAQSFSSMWGKHATEFVAPLSTHVPKIPMSIDLAILKTLAKKPESRYIDIAAFLAALGTGLASHTSGLPLSLVSSTVTNIIGNTPLPTTIANSNASTSDTNKLSPTEKTENILLAPDTDLSQSGIPRNPTGPISQSGIPRNPTDPISYADLSETATDSTDTTFLTEKTQTNPIEVTPIPKLPTPSGIRLHIEDNQHQSAPEIGTNVQLLESTDQVTDILQVDPNHTSTDSGNFYSKQPTEMQDKVQKKSEVDLLSNDRVPTSVYAPLPQRSKRQRPLKLWISAISVIVILVGFLLPYFLSHVPNHSIINSGQNNKDITKNTVVHATNTARATTIVLQPAVQPKPVSSASAMVTATPTPAATKMPALSPTITSTGAVSKNPAMLPTSVQIAPTATPVPHGTGSVQIDTGGSGTGSFVADEDYSYPFPDRPSSDSSVSDPIDTSGVSNPAPASVYQSARIGDSLYTIPNLTPNTTYNVRLHFAETYRTQAGIRSFNVTINGQQVLSNFDIFAVAGAKDKAVVEQFTITPTSQGTISIEFKTVHDNAEVSGIEVLAN